MSDPIEELRRLCLALDQDFDKQLARVKRTIEELAKVSASLRASESANGGA